MQNDHSKDDIIQRSIELSLMVIKYAEELESNNKHLIACQVLKSSIAIGVNIMAARSAEHKDEVMEKFRIADRKAHETWYWFYLCEQSAGYNFNKELSAKLDVVMELLHKTIYK